MPQWTKTNKGQACAPPRGGDLVSRFPLTGHCFALVNAPENPVSIPAWEAMNNVDSGQVRWQTLSIQHSRAEVFNVALIAVQERLLALGYR